MMKSVEFKSIVFVTTEWNHGIGWFSVSLLANRFGIFFLLSVYILSSGVYRVRCRMVCGARAQVVKRENAMTTFLFLLILFCFFSFGLVSIGFVIKFHTFNQYFFPSNQVDFVVVVVVVVWLLAY